MITLFELDYGITFPHFQSLLLNSMHILYFSTPLNS